MNKYCFVWICLLLPFGVSGEDQRDHHAFDVEDSSPPTILNMESRSSALMCGCVNAISGDYVESTIDMVVPGPEPLIFERFYTSSSQQRCSLMTGWRHGFESYINVEKARITHRDQILAYYHRRSGSTLVFGDESSRIPQGPSVFMGFNKEKNPKGLTNYTGQISGKSNIKNDVIRYDMLKSGRSMTVTTGASAELLFSSSGRRYYDTGSLKYFLIQEKMPNGNRLQYKYDTEKLNPKRHSEALISVEATDTSQRTSYGSIQWKERYDKQKEAYFTDVVGSDGKKVVYQYKYYKNFSKRPDVYLSQLQRVDGSTVTFDYDKKMMLKKGDEKSGAWQYHCLKRKNMPEGRFIEIAYYKPGDDNLVMGEKHPINYQDFRLGRVCKLIAPVGVDEKPIVTAQFLYQIDVASKGNEGVITGGTTMLFDAYQHKIAYQYSGEQRLTSIIKHTGTGKYQPYSTIKYGWGADNSKDADRLISQSFEDGQGKLQWHRAYTYDRAGNILKDILYGNLSGCAISPTSEKYVKEYRYSEDGLNLMTVQIEEGVKTVYLYKPGTDLLIAKLISEGSGIRERYFYDYNDCGILTCEIMDDGKGTECRDLSGVTQRMIRRIEPTTVAPIGLPKEVVESCLDVATGKEIKIRRTVNRYCRWGNLLQKDVYDSQDKYTFSLHWEYDLNGNVILECDPYGTTTTRAYDSNSNLILEQGPHPEYRREMTYDFSNRLIRIDEFHSEGQHISESFSYDYLGNRVKRVDSYGNTTSYVYDDLSRAVKTLMPAVENDRGKLVTPTSTAEYSVLNMPTETRDSKGVSLKMAYTVRGEPCLIEYPDGTVQKKEYYLNGNLKRSIDKDGVIHLYRYDYKNRVTRTQVLSPTGELLSSTSATYDAFHLLSEKDAMGHITRYRYDPAGRLLEVAKGNRKITFDYDNMGRRNKTITRFGSEADQVRITFQKYDLRDRLIAEGIEDSNGNVLQEMQYEYDVLGNRTHVKDPNGSVTVTKYDSRSRVIGVIDPLGQSSHTIYNESYRNAHNQKILQIVTTDRLGNQAEVIHDTHGRPYLFLRKDSFGMLISKRELRYDIVGNIVRTIDAVIDAQAVQLRENHRVCEYDSLRRPTRMVEAKGTREQRITSYNYHKNGKKASTVKPDGNLITYDYDFLGRMTTYRDSRETFAYLYAYDANNNLLRSEDAIAGTSTLRNYDAYDQLKKEQLGNGLETEYSYDNIGRLIGVKLPDRSAVSYDYDSAFLQTVTRYSWKEGALQEQYKHHYDHYDACGHLKEASLIQQAGKISYAHDVLGRLKEKKTSRWSQSDIRYDAEGNLLGYKWNDGRENGPVACTFAYDHHYQLTQEQGFCKHDYAHDSLLNRISMDDKQYTHNHLNEIVNCNGTAYAYDPNGNLISKNGEDGIHYEYDGLDRLVKVSKGNQEICYTYDALHRRIHKSLTDSAGTSQHVDYLYLGQNEIGAKENGAITELRILGAGSSIAVELDGIAFAPIHDKVGNVAALVDDNGELAETYRYSAFGNEVDSQHREGRLNPWRFSDKRHDPETGLIYFGRRYYDPEDGRWITTDPAGYDVGPNLYAYVKNCPTTYVDLYGLFHHNHDEDRQVREQLDANCDELRSRESEWGRGTEKSREAEAPVHLGTPPEAVQQLLSLPGLIIAFIGDHLLPIPYIRDVVSWCGRFLSSLSVDWNPSYSGPHSCHTIVGNQANAQGKVSNVVGNGIMNTKEDGTRFAAIISTSHGGSPVHLAWGATKGFMMDLFESIAFMCGFCTHSSYILECAIVAALEEVGGSGLVHVSLHSRGGLALYALQKHLSPEQKSQLVITTYGSAKIIDGEGYHQVTNYVSKNDPIPMITNPIAYTKALLGYDNGIVFLDPVEGSPFFDHSFSDGDRMTTYRVADERVGLRFQEMYQHN
jgi:RHS repeat-associated protein